MLKYSVVIPVHNGGRTIERAIKSALSQTLSPQYIIVFDNASTDDTVQVALRLARKNPKIRVIQNSTKLNALESFRSSITNIEGRFIWLAADDILLASAIYDLWQSRCQNNCEHAIGHRAIFFNNELSLKLGKNFTDTLGASSPATKFLEFPADNSIFYSLVNANTAREMLPRSEKYAWDWIYTARLLTEPIHYQNVNVGLLRETSPINAYQSQARGAVKTLDRIFPLRRASREFLGLPNAIGWERIKNIAILNLYVAIMFGTLSIDRNSFFIKIFRKIIRVADLLVGTFLTSVSKFLKGIFVFLKPFLNLKRRQFIYSRFKHPKPFRGFISQRFGNSQFKESTGLKGFENSTFDSNRIAPFTKVNKVLAMNPSEFTNFGDLVSLSKHLASRSNLEVELLDHFRSRNQARIFHGFVEYGLISNIRFIKNEKSFRTKKSIQMNIEKIDDFSLLEWKDKFNRTAISAIRKSRGRKGASRRILVCLPEVPVPNRDSGSNDIIYYLLLLTNLGHKVTVCVPHRSAELKSLHLLESICEVQLYPEVSQKFDNIIVYGPYAYKLFYDLGFSQDYIYIMIDAVFRRARQSPETLNASDEAILEFEANAIVGSRVSFAISQSDINESRLVFPNSSFEFFPIIRNFHHVEEIQKRERVLFVGSLSHTPNAEALKFILKEIAPKVQKLHPNLIFTIVGKGTDESKEISSNVVRLGMLNSLDEIYSESLVSLAPMRIAAGINGKVIESIGFGVHSLVSPAVSMNLSESMMKCTFVCETSDEYVEAISRIYQNGGLIPKKTRFAVAKEIDGHRNAELFRKYLK